MKPLLTLAVCLLSISAHADRRSMIEALSAIENVPSRAELLTLAGNAAPELLRSIVLSPPAQRLAVTRAIAALGYFPSRATDRVLRTLITRYRRSKKGIELLDLQQALVAYGVAAGRSALPTVRPFLTHLHPDVRIAAATALWRSDPLAARRLLSEQLTREKEGFVRAEVERLLARGDGRRR
ncbi:MAG: hypothetical protein H6707_09775 [Deltaproteobacteria bacterium]|nr:hypothetical protein [Deltaproteobacteria bacterium]